MRSKISAMLAATAALALSACGGGSGGSAVGVQSTPVPPPAPTPTPTSASVTIFPAPAPGEYASVGASIAGPGGNLDTYQSATDRFGTVSTSQADQAHVRYTAGGYYEVKLAGEFTDWATGALPMTKTATGFEITLSPSAKLQGGILYGYKLIADGNWKIDPAGKYRKIIGGEMTSGLQLPECDAGPDLLPGRAGVPGHDRLRALPAQVVVHLGVVAPWPVVARRPVGPRR